MTEIHANSLLNFSYLLHLYSLCDTICIVCNKFKFFLEFGLFVTFLYCVENKSAPVRSNEAKKSIFEWNFQEYCILTETCFFIPKYVTADDKNNSKVIAVQGVATN